jgi:hypothetical protein
MSYSTPVMSYNFLTHDTSVHGRGTNPFGLNTLVLNVSMRVTTYKINSGTSMNFIQKYVSITLLITFTLLSL